MPSKFRPLAPKNQLAPSQETPSPVSPTPITPAPLWQVVEIEGEATPVTRETTAEQPLLPAPLSSAPAVMVDDKIVIGLETHHLTIATEETALFGVNVLNNGDRRAHFELTVEGAIDPQWLVITVGEQPPLPFAPAMTLEVGDRATFWLAITPPRTPLSAAGDYPLRISVRAAEYPGRLSQQNALLTLTPYVDFTLGAAKPLRLTTSWRRRTRQVMLPLINRSNQPLTLTLRSRTTAPDCRCELVAPALHRDASGQTTMTLRAGQRAVATARIALHASPWLQLEKRRDQVQIAVAPLTQPEMVQTGQVQIQTRPLFSSWHLASLLLLAGGGLISLLVFAVVVLLLALRPTPLPVSLAPPAAPPIAIVVNLAQPAVANPPANLPPTPIPQAAIANVVNLAAEQTNPDPSLPVVEAAQISAPGEAAAAPPPASAFSPQASNSAAESPKTYQQMFLEVALRYDLNWRVLAAQAYIESSFDPLALGNSGDLGLMQILPGTWREWAPTVNATDPFDSYSNTLVAAVYLDYLRSQLGKKGYPQIEWMLVAYNWGIDKVLDHLAAGQGWDDLPSQRRQYALDILRIAETIPQ